jgi:RNA polymerase sigma-70 factor, ECF subfamily
MVELRGFSRSRVVVSLKGGHDPPPPSAGSPKVSRVCLKSTPCGYSIRMATPRTAEVPPRLRVVKGGAPSVASEPYPDDITDEALVAALREGEAQKAAILYDRLIRVVDGALVRILGRREQDHDDLVQSVFEQIIVALQKDRFEGGSTLRGWASAIACNIGLNALRSRIRERRVVDRARDADMEARRAGTLVDAERQASARSELGRVCEELAAVSPEKATAVLLFDVFGHDLAEVAALTGVSMAAAQSRLVRGRKELHERLRRAEVGPYEPRLS